MNDQRLSPYLQKEFLYDEMLCGFISFDARGNILSINKTMARWVGVDFPIDENSNFKALMTKSSLLYYNMIVEPLLSLQSTVNEISLKFQGINEVFDALLSAECYKEDNGEVLLVNATVQRISERKRYETELLGQKRRAEEEKRRFEFLFNSAPAMIWTMDERGKILMLNKRVSDFFIGGSLLERPSLESLLEERKFSTLKTWKSLMNRGERFEREMKLRGKTGKLEWFSVYAEPYYNENGHIESWYCSGININTKKLLHLANQAKWQSNLSSAYEELDKNRELFVKIANNQSHMIRKPLANILGLVSLLKDESISPDVANLIEMLTASAIELDEMIRNTVSK